MNDTCSYRPCTTTHRAPGASRIATRASWVGTPVSTPGSRTTAVSPGPERRTASTIGAIKGCSEAFVTRRSAASGPRRQTMKDVLR